MNDQDRSEFNAFLRACTDDQVRGVWQKEKTAGRTDYQRLAEGEAKRRKIEL